MPQETPAQNIPVEAGDELAFTPPSLAEIAGAPVFTLRAPTTREKRHRQRILIEERVRHHDRQAMRAATLRAVEAGFPDLYAKHKGLIEAYWQAADDFELQAKDDPDLKWEYDPQVEERIAKLLREAAENSAEVARMAADNVEYGEIAVVSLQAVVIAGWAGLDVPRQLYRGNLTLDCVDAMIAALGAIEESHSIPRGTATLELIQACQRRYNLEEEERKNSVSPSPSSTTPSISSPGEGSNNGKSPASAPSKKTRQSE
jgi:hypothetical protein